METFETLNREELEELTNKELKEIIRTRNEEVGTRTQDIGYLPTTGKKNDLIDAIIHAQEIVTTKLGVTEVDNDRHTVKNSQLVFHPSNYRYKVDYFDPRLQERFRKSGYEFLHDLVVTPTGEFTDDEDNPQPTFRVVSGNRSLYNWRLVLEEDGVDPDDLDVPVNVREYTDEDEQSAEIAETLELGMANEMQREMSPVDKMHWFQDLARKGLTQSAIAVEVYGPVDGKGKQSVISKTLKLSLLPEKILELVHYDFNANNYIANGVEWMEQMKIPFEVDEDGNVTVLGVSQSAADEMMKLYPRTNAEDAEEGIEAVNEFLLSDPEILVRASTETASGFRQFLREQASEAGIIELSKGKKAPSKTADDDELATDAETAGADDGIEDLEDGLDLDNAGEERQSSSSGAEYRSVDYSTMEAATDLEKGLIGPSEDFENQFAELLHTGETDALRVFKFLRYHGLIEDVV